MRLGEGPVRLVFGVAAERANEYSLPNLKIR